jgi:ornithine cyclodeaminase/alanine dehydrogenase-like protein (mu-crystallin family)
MAVCPTLTECRFASRTIEREQTFLRQMAAILPSMKFIAGETNLEVAVKDADILVTATSAQAPMLKAAWMKPGTFYTHIGGWEDEYAVAQQCDKIVCDDWENVKHRGQTLCRMYKEGLLQDSDIYANLDELVVGAKRGRENAEERVYFNAVGLAHVDVSIAWAMYQRATERGFGQKLTMQKMTIFEHPNIARLLHGEMIKPANRRSPKLGIGGRGRYFEQLLHQRASRSRSLSDVGR